MRRAGDVGYAEVYRDESGLVEYIHQDDMEFALDGDDAIRRHNEYSTKSSKATSGSRKMYLRARETRHSIDAYSVQSSCRSDGNGVVEYVHQDDMGFGLCRLHQTKFKCDGIERDGSGVVMVGYQ
ncbi:unnamed protein product [Clavelina lepadiformis]|uniref:Uncharacterized protein n=1 Tax=Clavelina lepadiformis TaxID=159417 RepID=A0ABP0GC10_CLALP